MVIQRWQTLLLLLTAGLMACFTFLSLGQVQTADYTFSFTTLGFCYEGEATGGAPTGYLIHTWYFFIISLMSIILPLIDIFLFKNLRLQKRVCLVSLIFIIATMATGASLGYGCIEGGSIGWSEIVLAPFIAIVTTVLAWYCMQRDHKLLQSADRLR